MNRRILFLIFLIVVIAAAAGAVFVLTGEDGDDQDIPPTELVQDNNDEQPEQPRATALPTATPIPLLEVVVALQDIRRGVRIQPNMVQVISVPEEYVPLSAFEDTEEVIGQIARTEIYREEFVLSSKVVPDLTGLAPAGSDAAAVLPPNRVAVAIPVDRLTSVGYAISPGDRVDVIVSMLFVDIDQEFQTLLPNVTRFVSIEPADEEDSNIVTLGFGEEGRGEFDTVNLRSDSLGGQRFESVLYEPSEEQQRPRLTSQTTVQDALVIWVGTFPSDGRLFVEATATPVASPTPLPEEEDTTDGEEGANEGGGGPAAPAPPDIVTLAVSPQEAVELTWFVEAGLPLTFALRSASSTSLQQTEAVTLNYIMNRFNIRVPERANYTVEPAIRSIRSIEVGDLAPLYEPQQQGGGEGEDGENGDGDGENDNN
jgi:pilus assembly protein CpaB